MQKISFLLFFIISGINSFSQQEFFIYFQADNHQPFYARINAKIYSSTENGYLIIPKLGDSLYQIVIGFAKNAYPEQIFAVAINKKDLGFQLKNLEDKGWSLVDLENMSVIPNSGLPLKAAPEFPGVRKTDAFSEMLADVVNDSAILYSAVKPKAPDPVIQKSAPVGAKPVEKEKTLVDSAIVAVEAVQPVIKEPAKVTDSAARRGNDLIGITITPKDATPKPTISQTKDIDEPVVKNADTARATIAAVTDKQAIEKPFITKIEEKKTEGQYQATYLEQYIYSTDTIKIVIPLTDSPVPNTTPPVAVPEKKVEPAAEPANANVTEEKVASLKAAVIDTAAAARRSAVQITNSDCVNLATDYDVGKLRVKLINGNTIDDKLATAKKYFKTKCLLVKQIKALTELFPTDETKYRFFDTAYPFVSDTSNFYQLEELIESNYYKNRFKAMIQK
jgi:hypothetical protein